MNTKQFFMGRAIGFILVLLIAGGAYWFWKSDQPKATEPGWKTTSNAQGITFQYPEKLSTTYITATDWPPLVAVTASPFTCTEAGQETARAGKTEKRRVGTRDYCVTTVAEGAAGSVYRQYSYVTATGNNKLVNLTFSVRFVQCANYDNPQKTQCEGERETFDLDSVVDRIVNTI